MTKGFPRTLRRAAVDDSLVELLRESPWEQLQRACQAAEPSNPSRSPEQGAQADTTGGH
jgi:hypothetical protein